MLSLNMWQELEFLKSHYYYYLIAKFGNDKKAINARNICLLIVSRLPGVPEIDLPLLRGCCFFLSILSFEKIRQTLLCLVIYSRIHPHTYKAAKIKGKSIKGRRQVCDAWSLRSLRSFGSLWSLRSLWQKNLLHTPKQIELLWIKIEHLWASSHGQL